MKHGVVLVALVLVSSFLFLDGSKISAHAAYDLDGNGNRFYFCSEMGLFGFREEMETNEFVENYAEHLSFFSNVQYDQEQAKQAFLAEKGYAQSLDVLGQNIQCLKVNGIDYRTIPSGEIYCKMYGGTQCDDYIPVVRSIHVQDWNALKEIAQENPEWFLIHAPNLGLSAFDLDYCKMNPNLLNSVLNDKVSQINSYAGNVEKGVPIGSMGDDRAYLEMMSTSNTLVAGEIAKCHIENNIPLEIPNLSPTAKSLFLAMYDYNRLSNGGTNQKFAPDFDRYILNAQNSNSTPEFGSLSGMIIVISIIGVIMISRRFNLRF